MQEVVVVGGSLAGAATAIHLAQRGRSVLLIDRATFPRRKPCGEGLFPRGVAELTALGIDTQALGLGQPLTSLRFSLDGHTAEAAIGADGSSALGVERSRLDAGLLDCARAAGVQVETGMEVRRLLRRQDSFAVEVAGRRLEAGALVAADGARSGLRSQAGLGRPARGSYRYGASAHLRLSADPPPRIDVHFKAGYEVYLTPVSDRVVNAAVLLRRPGMRALAGDLASGYASLLRDSGVVPDPYEIVDEPLATGPFPASARRAWRDNLVLVGDAAGFFDPITGEGMSLALLSARHCAEAVDAFLKTGSPEPFRTYERRRRSLGRNSTLLARLMLALASRPLLGRRAIDNLARRPDVFRRLTAINSGDLPLTALRPGDLLALTLGR